MIHRGKWGIFLSLQFMIMIYLFTRSLYSPFFILLIALFLLVAFLSEEHRLFAWIIIAFFLGHLLLGYMDHFIGSFRFPQFSLLLGSQLLLLLPIVMIHFVCKKFKKANYPYLQKPMLTKKEKFPFSVTWKQFFVVSPILFTLVLIEIHVMKSGAISWSHLFFSISFSVIHTVLGEVMWRGILLPNVISLTNKWIGILVTSIAFGINMTIFGFSPLTTISYIFLGFLFGVLTIKSQSIIPSIIVSTTIILLLIISGSVTIPV
jgi:uncharacterized protein